MADILSPLTLDGEDWANMKYVSKYLRTVANGTKAAARIGKQSKQHFQDGDES